MKFGPVPLQAAAGLILGHNIAGLDGRRALRKGRALSALDLAQLTALGRSTVYVAEMAADDVAEDAAARRVAAAVAGSNLRCSGAASGRVNLAASVRGVLRVDAGRLLQVNALPGITVATLANHSPVQARQLAATVKIVPFAVPDALVRNCEEVAAAEPLLWLDSIPARRAAIILSGSAPASARIIADFEPALRGRLEALGASVNGVHFVALEDEGGEAALAAMLRQQLDAGCEMILLAGETAIMDRADIAPRAVERAGGSIACFGVPVDPGNLLMLAYMGSVPVLGAPGCARSRKANIVDWVLPRLLAGDRVTQAELAALGHGGLLEEIPERPAPRIQLEEL
jgi:molybdenum cofactor cytidylyltransferase